MDQCKEDHAKDALHQADCDIKICGVSSEEGGKRKGRKEQHQLHLEGWSARNHHIIMDFITRHLVIM